MKNVIMIIVFAVHALLTSGVYAATGDTATGKTKSASCQGCHGANGISTNPKIPNLAGQKYEYLITSMKDFKMDKRKDPMMVMAAKALSDADIADLAAYYSGIK